MPIAKINDQCYDEITKQDRYIWSNVLITARVALFVYTERGFLFEHRGEKEGKRIQFPPDSQARKVEDLGQPLHLHDGDSGSHLHVHVQVHAHVLPARFLLRLQATARIRLQVCRSEVV